MAKAEKSYYTPAGMIALGNQVLWCQICDSRQVDSAKPETGKFYMVHGLARAADTPPTSIFLAICPHCKYTDAMTEAKNIETVLVRS